MKNKPLHIVAFTVPFPANYGGAIDVFYKIKALQKQGVVVILHCFQYNRKAAPELLKYCKEVHYYRRKNSVSRLLSKKPYIVATRDSNSLIERLQKDDFPILLEGIHCAGVLEQLDKKERKIIVRSHNIEHDYYEHLALIEKSLFKKIYFILESKKLLKYEQKVFPLADNIWGISKKDTEYLQKNYGKGIHISAFHQFSESSFTIEKEDFAFYHGNLAIGENDQAAKYLVKEVVSRLNYPLIIAGNNPSKELISCCEDADNVTLKANIDSKEIIELLEKAQMNVLPTFQNTGIKLKLLAALFKGKHCIVSPEMVEGTGLENVCLIAREPQQFVNYIKEMALTEFTEVEFEKRKTVLGQFSNELNAEVACDSIWGKT